MVFPFIVLQISNYFSFLVQLFGTDWSGSRIKFIEQTDNPVDGHFPLMVFYSICAISIKTENEPPHENTINR